MKSIRIPNPVKPIDQVRNRIRAKHYSIRIEQVCFLKNRVLGNRFQIARIRDFQPISDKSPS